MSDSAVYERDVCPMCCRPSSRNTSTSSSTFLPFSSSSSSTTSSSSSLTSTTSSHAMHRLRQSVVLLMVMCVALTSSYEQIPKFTDLKVNYPGYAHHGGQFHNHQVIDDVIGVVPGDRGLLLHDTSALRLSAAFNKISGPHTLGKDLIRLSKFGRDSVSGVDGLQYLYHPIAYGPYLADKYGYPNVSKLHQFDPQETKKNFYGRQGVLRVITYTHLHNLPKGHVALWDCDHFHQARDWMQGEQLITVEFWESPDSSCSHLPATSTPSAKDKVSAIMSALSPQSVSATGSKSVSSSSSSPAQIKSRHGHWERLVLRKYWKVESVPVQGHRGQHRGQRRDHGRRSDVIKNLTKGLTTSGHL